MADNNHVHNVRTSVERYVAAPSRTQIGANSHRLLGKTLGTLLLGAGSGSPLSHRGHPSAHLARYGTPIAGPSGDYSPKKVCTCNVLQITKPPIAAGSIGFDSQTLQVMTFITRRAVPDIAYDHPM